MSMHKEMAWIITGTKRKVLIHVINIIQDSSILLMNFPNQTIMTHHPVREVLRRLHQLTGAGLAAATSVQLPSRIPKEVMASPTTLTLRIRTARHPMKHIGTLFPHTPKKPRIMLTVPKRPKTNFGDLRTETINNLRLGIILMIQDTMVTMGRCSPPSKMLLLHQVVVIIQGIEADHVLHSMMIEDTTKYH